jgi:hypothetical protein
MEVKMSQSTNKTTKKQVPLDILQVYGFLQDFRQDLTDVMMMAVDDWSAALLDDIKDWKDSAGPEPSWQSFREWMNDICRDDVMPLLFPDPVPEKQSNDSREQDPAPAGFVAGKGDAFDYLPDWMQVPALYHNEDKPNPLAVIKLFTPDSSWCWFLMEADGDDLLFGLVVGLETEFGYVSLAELESVTGPMGLHIERDLWFQPTPVRELPEYRERWGSDGPYPGGLLISTPQPDSSSPAEDSEGDPSSQPDILKLPDGWTTSDIHMLLEMLAEGPILVADSKLGIPSIHDNFGAETCHLGFGFMQVAGNEYTLRFDAGGAMRRTPSGNGWTKLSIEGQYDGYDINAVHRTLKSWLKSELEPEEIHPWKMTRLAYQEYKALRVGDGVPILNGADGEEHERLVRAALARCEIIPDEVLMEYPNLQRKVGEADDCTQHKT